MMYNDVYQTHVQYWFSLVNPEDCETIMKKSYGKFHHYFGLRGKKSYGEFHHYYLGWKKSYGEIYHYYSWVGGVGIS